MHHDEQRSTVFVCVCDERDIDDHRLRRILQGFPLPGLMYGFHIHSMEASREFDPHRIRIVVNKELKSVHNTSLPSAPEGFIELNHAHEFGVADLLQRQFGRKQIAVRIEGIELRVHATQVAGIGETFTVLQSDH